MRYVRLADRVGTFAEDKDAAAQIRREELLPALDRAEPIELDFAEITLTTQSFIHALLSQALRMYGEDALKHIKFKNCATAPRGIIETVVQYVLEANESE